jgi:streptomycin 6-kinase
VTAGRPEVDALARTARAVASEWGIRLGEPFPLARFSFVAPAGDDLVLKLTPPEDDESDEEALALELWSGDGAVRALRRDPARRAILMERLRPGTDLAGMEEDRATAIAVDVARRLWRPAAAPFRWIGDHVPGWLDRAGEGRARALLPHARRLYGALDVGRGTLVHGDFHHHNLLASGSGYVAIDPKPMRGEPEFDVPPFLWNPLGYRMRLDVTERRLGAFAAAGLDEERMRAWAVIRGAYLGADEHGVEVLRALL